MGSSPLTRGALPQLIGHLAALGIIPAYAGSTQCCMLWDKDAEDHPRLRGEHVGPYERLDVPLGSSPLTRGARQHALGARWQRGIIPAYAGSTLS